MEWISCKDRLPGKDQIVDIWCRNRRMSDYTYRRNYGGQRGNDFFDPTKGGICCLRIDREENMHWMPIPEPPE